MSTTTTPTTRIDHPTIDALDPRTRSLLVLPDDDGWDDARQAWNLTADQRPVAVALPETTDDVIALASWAREAGLRVAPQSTGHNATAIASLDGAVLLRTSRMRDVRIDAVNRIARVQSGAWWQDVTAAAAAHGLAALAGSSGDVGVAGYVLGGGVSWLARRHGLASNSVTAIELVTADGRLVRSTADHEPELFWALRGGGGSFGIVTAIELRLLPLAEVHAGALFWPVEASREVWHTWRRWTTDLPESVTSIVRILAFPPFPDVPEPLRGNTFAVVEATFLCDATEADVLLRPLRALAPAMDTMATIPAGQLGMLHMDPPQPVPGLSGHSMLDSLPADAVDAILAVAGPGTGSPLLGVEIRHLGGALARVPDGAGAVGGLAGEYMVFSVGVPMDPSHATAITASNRAVETACGPWTSAHPYLNFVEAPTDAATFFDGDTWARLRAVKQAHDPEDVILSNHPVPPLYVPGSRTITAGGTVSITYGLPGSPC